MTELLLLPALSSISTRDEWAPLVASLPDMACRTEDWPGFGARPRGAARPSPATLRAFLRELLATVPPGTVALAAGHAATYLADAAARAPSRLSALVLVAPTWRGPLPTMFARTGPKPRLAAALRRAMEAPVLGHALYRANMSDLVVGHMMREHVYADRAFVTPALRAAKRAVTNQPGARFGTAAFVTGALDPVASRDEFLALFGRALPPTLLLRPDGAPPRSAAEMDALAATGTVTATRIPGALAAHEEHPEAVAAALRAFLSEAAVRPAAPRADTPPG